MRLVVLGAGGQLGHSMSERAIAQGHTVIALTRRQADITQPKTLGAALAAAAPDAVFNCAAYARVDEAEDEPVEAFAANAWALRDLARLSRALSFTLVHYSTDFVFEGFEPIPRVETDATNPRGVYATSKLLGERFAAEAPAHYILRVESLFGGPAGKSSVDALLNGLIAGREVRPFADRTVSPSFVDDVSDASLKLVTLGAPAGLYHCVNSGHTTWLELTRTAAHLLNRPESQITPINMVGLTMRVPRPLLAALSNEKLRSVGVEMPTWQDALARYIVSRNASCG